MDSKFLVFKDPVEGLYNFQLMNGEEILLVGNGFQEKTDCLLHINIVKVNAPFQSRYERRDAFLLNKFILRSRNGLVIGTSKNYFTRAKRDNIIEAVKKTARFVPVEDLTDHLEYSTQ